MKSTMRSRAYLALLGLLTYYPLVSFASQTFYDLDTPCNPISNITCALPYPSDVYAKEDIHSPTGLRLDYPVGAVREELLEDVPPSLTPQTVFNGSSGFSAATGVLFELDSPPDLNTIPADGGESVIAFNLETGERVPLRVQLNEYARSHLVSAPSQIIEIYPRSRWNFEGRYAVYLTSYVKKLNGEDYQPSTGFSSALYDQHSKVANYYQHAFEFFENRGYDRKNLLSATFFTVRDEYEATGRLIELTKSVYAKEHPVRNLKVFHKFFGHIGAFVTGELLVHNFRDQYGVTKSHSNIHRRTRYLTLAILDTLYHHARK